MDGKNDFYDSKIKPFKNQNYEELKKISINNRQLFEDPFFTATDKSLFYTQSVPYGIKWKRPGEITKTPKFLDGNVEAGDLDQGDLGNCWFIAGCAAIALSPELFSKVVPQNQAISGDDYAGIFHFRFWIYGEWHDVVIDDRLPVKSDNKLLFCSNKQQPNEFWAALLEKAYAKVCANYENLDGGCTTDAIIDMSGGIEESFDMKKMKTEREKTALWETIIKSRKLKSMIGASIPPNPYVKEARLYNGLVQGHAYTVTKVALIERFGTEVKLICVRNPWGNDVEWKGAWCDGSFEWNSISTDIKKALSFQHLPDGEFWMNFDDFYRNFESIQFCHLSPESFSTELIKNKNIKLFWKMIAHNGEWKIGKNSGGCGQPDEKAYWTNPQYLITLTDVDDGDNENMATVIISLMQKYTREKRIETRGESAEEFIQFRLYRVINATDAEKVRKTNQRLYASQLERVGTSGSYINLRDVTKRFRIPPGDYIIIPSCYDEGVNGEFLIRIFTENEINANNHLVLNDHKNNLTEKDLFFVHDNLDDTFNSWNNLLGEPPKIDQGELKLRSSQIVQGKQSVRNLSVNAQSNSSKINKVYASPKSKDNVKEACNIM